MVADPLEAARFYGEWFGWTERAEDLGGFGNAAVLCDAQGTVAAVTRGSPSGWCPSVAVPSLEAAVEAFRKAGGRVRIRPEQPPGGPRFAEIEDAQGASLLLAEPGWPVRPEWSAIHLGPQPSGVDPGYDALGIDSPRRLSDESACWRCVLSVDAIEATAARGESLGAVRLPESGPEVVWMKDPFGAVLGIR